ncbi:MAG: histidine phosphatase family protein [Gammaproteobacteria bacterium]|nr:histidine phosphatase family protein [Gammaproteobacteria bacterium]
MDVYLIRHTTPDIDPGICHGRLDAPLRSGVEDRVERLAGALPQAAPITTAASRRCRGLADPLAARLGSTVTVDDRLREMDFGHWEGRPWRTIARAETDAWTRDFWNRAPPEGESYAAMHARVAAVWEALPGRGSDSAVLIAPAGPLRALITIALELPAEAILRIHVDHGGLARLSDATGGWRLEFSNR